MKVEDWGKDEFFVSAYAVYGGDGSMPLRALVVYDEEDIGSKTQAKLVAEHFARLYESDLLFGDGELRDLPTAEMDAVYENARVLSEGVGSGPPPPLPLEGPRGPEALPHVEDHQDERDHGEEPPPTYQDHQPVEEP